MISNYKRLKRQKFAIFGAKYSQSSEKNLFDAVDGVVQEGCQAAADG